MLNNGSLHAVTTFTGRRGGASGCSTRTSYHVLFKLKCVCVFLSLARPEKSIPAASSGGQFSATSSSYQTQCMMGLFRDTCVDFSQISPPPSQHSGPMMYAEEPRSPDLVFPPRRPTKTAARSSTTTKPFSCQMFALPFL